MVQMVFKFGFSLASSEENYEETNKLREHGLARVMELVSGAARLKPRPSCCPSLQDSHFHVTPGGNLVH